MSKKFLLKQSASRKKSGATIRRSVRLITGQLFLAQSNRFLSLVPLVVSMRKREKYQWNAVNDPSASAWILHFFGFFLCVVWLSSTGVPIVMALVPMVAFAMRFTVRLSLIRETFRSVRSFHAFFSSSPFYFVGLCDSADQCCTSAPTNWQRTARILFNKCHSTNSMAFRLSQANYFPV